MRFSPLVLVLAVAIVGCASSGSAGSTSAASPAQSAAHRNPDVITADELHSTSYSNLYDAIRRLRPGMLAPHGGSESMSISNQSAIVVNVYQDGVKLDGGISALRNISPDAVHEVRYLSPTDATQLYGTGNAAGAIIVSSH